MYVSVERQARTGIHWETLRGRNNSARDKAVALFHRNLMTELQSADLREFEEFWEALDPRLTELFLLYTIPIILKLVLPDKF